MDAVVEFELRRKLTLTESGQYALELIATLTAAELVVWMRAHLSGVDPYLPIDPAHDLPADAPCDLYEQISDAEFRSNFTRAVSTLLVDAVTPNALAHHCDAVFELFDVIARTQCSVEMFALLRMVQSGILKDLCASDGANLHEKLLLTIGALQRPIPISTWLTEMNDPRFARAAFLSLCEMHPTTAIAYLPTLTRALGEPTKLDVPMMILLDRCGRPRALMGIGQVMQAEEDAVVRETVYASLERLHIPREDVQHAVAGKVAEDVARWVMEGGPSRNDSIEPIVTIRNVDVPEIAVEHGYYKYITKWRLFPTIDATSLALHSLRTLGAAEAFLETREQNVLRFVVGCLNPQSGGFGLTPYRRATPGLYATINALQALKALANVPSGARWVDRIETLAKTIGRDLVEEITLSARNIVQQHCRDGLPIDEVNDEPSLHALDFAVGIFWNLEPDPIAEAMARAGIRKDRVVEFTRACRDQARVNDRLDGEGLDIVVGYRAKPTARIDGPCATTTSMVVRIAHRTGWLELYDQAEVITFLHAMQEQKRPDDRGGFRVFPGQRATLSATAFALEAFFVLRQWDRFHHQNAREFISRCRQNGGYALNPLNKANIGATRHALRVSGLLQVKPERPEHVSEFLASLYDAETGGFYGYSPQAYSPQA